MVEISIVVLSHNNKSDLEDCIKSINKLNFPKKNLEIIVVDNGSIDGTTKMIKKNFPNIDLVMLPTNFGAPHALNIGFKKAKGNYILKCDDDIVLEKNCLKILFDYLETYPEVGVVGPKNYFKDSPKEVAKAAHNFNFWIGITRPAGNLNTKLEPDYVKGCASLFCKKLLKIVGYLDEGYGLWLFDDQDFCLQVKRHGYKVVYLPQAKIWHSYKKITASKIEVFLKQWYKNKIRFILKNANIYQIITSLAAHLILVLIYIFSSPLKAKIIIQGLVWNIVNFNATLRVRKNI